VTIWLDAQLPPQLAAWLRTTFEVQAVALREIGLRDAAGQDIYDAARAAGAVLISKDADFVELVTRRARRQQDESRSADHECAGMGRRQRLAMRPQ
jgi:predicted nuclease of predicted toxin-antitoxin system